MSWLSPGRWLLVGAFVAALLLGVWRLDMSRQQIGYDRAQDEATVKALAAEKAARTKEQAMQATTTKAIKDAQARQTKLQADATASRRAADSLRSDLATANRRLSTAPRDAVAEYATTANLVFAECSRAQQELAAKADGHASDVRLMQEAWAK